MSDNRISQIDKYRRRPGFNIGIILFGVAFIYLVANILISLTNKPATIYEVRYGSVYRDTSFTGLALRDESIVNADEDGYVNYFASEGSKVGVKTMVYASSADKLDFSTAKGEAAGTLSDDDKTALYSKIDSFSSQFSAADFDSVYQLRDTIEQVLDDKSNQSRTTQLNDMIAGAGDSLKVHNAAADGIISTTLDGFEDVTADQVTSDMITDSTGYKKEVPGNNTKVSTGDPVYKLIRDNRWQIAIALDDKDAAGLADQSSVKIKFKKDNMEFRAGLEIKDTKSGKVGILTLDTGAVRYYKDRYVDIELVRADESGLKIPKSAVTEKKFYAVPEKYLTQGGNSNSTGVLIDNGSDNPTFQAVNIYGRDTEKELVYIEPSVFKADHPTLILPESTEKLQLNETKSLKGAYNINKGYAVFRKIDVLADSDGYYIIDVGSDYGLKNYDHIALDASAVAENSVVF